MSLSNYEKIGAPPNKQPKYAAIYQSGFLTGLWTQRAVLHSPGSPAEQYYYGNRNEALWDGVNIELTNRLTLQRRPGSTPFSSFLYPTPPDSAFSFQLTDGTIQVLVDTTSTGPLSITSVDLVTVPTFSIVQSVSGGTGGSYNFVIPNPVNPNNQLLMVMGIPSNGAVTPTVTNIQDSLGNVWVRIFASGRLTGYTLYAYLCQGPAAGAPTITVTIENALNTVMGCVLEIEGLVTPSFDVSVFNRQTSGTPLATGVSSSTDYAPEAVLAFGWIDNTAILSPAGGASLITGDSISQFSILAQLVTNNFSQQGTFQSTMTASGSYNHAAILALSFRKQQETTTYHGAFPNGANNAYAGMRFLVQGNGISFNNGTFVAASSTGTTITLYNSGGNAETSPAGATMESSGAVYWDQQTGNAPVILAKAPGAGPTRFTAVAGTCYMGDGVETAKYTPGNPNGLIWNWGITAPSKAPTAVASSSGSQAVAWRANTVFSTMGLLLDSNNNIQFLTSVNSSGTNNTNFGNTGQGTPNWNYTQGASTTETSGSGLVWTCAGQITQWAANTTYLQNQPIWDPTTGGVFLQWNSGSNQSGDAYPKFNGQQGQWTNGDNQCKWGCVGNVSSSPQDIAPWKHSFGYTHFDSPICCVVSPGKLPPAGQLLPSQPIYLFYLSGPTGTSGTGYTPVWQTTPGNLTVDGDLIWMCLGPKAWAARHVYSAWGGSGVLFSAVVNTNGSGSMEVCVQTGASGGTQPDWLNGDGSAVTYGDVTLDGGVTWVCVGTELPWNANTTWFLPTGGFTPPSSGNPFGSSAIIDSNNNVQYAIHPGKSGGSVPTWNTNLYGNTTDNTVLWDNTGAYNPNSLAWTNGFTYAVSFGSRLSTDPFNTTAPPGLAAPLGTPTGALSGHISTASPTVFVPGPSAGGIITLKGFGSLDPQVDTIYIWRSPDEADGGDDMLLLTAIPNPANGGTIGGNVGSLPVYYNPATAGFPTAAPNSNGTFDGPNKWVFVDYLPSVPTANFPGLNTLLPAPIDDVNDPPAKNFLPNAYNFQRIWGTDGTEVPWSGGPDTLVGNPNESFNPADEISYLAPGVRLVKTTAGLVVFLTNSVEIILGGPVTSSFYSVPLCPNQGLATYTALDVYAGEIFFFGSDSQMYVISPQLQIANFGYPVGDKLAQISAGSAYVAYHKNGTDVGLFITNGVDSWYRCNPHQPPGFAGGPEPVWSCRAQFASGLSMVQSVETTPGIKQLLIGSTVPNQPILYRDTTVFADNGTPYDANFTIGSIVLTHPGEVSALKFLEFDISGVGFQPTVSYLLNEISGAFTDFVLPPQADSPSVYGDSIAASYSPNRYYFEGTGSIAIARHLQIMVDFGANAVGSEMYAFTIFGRRMIEP